MVETKQKNSLHVLKALYFMAVVMDFLCRVQRRVTLFPEITKKTSNVWKGFVVVFYHRYMFLKEHFIRACFQALFRSTPNVKLYANANTDNKTIWEWSFLSHWFWSRSWDNFLKHYRALVNKCIAFYPLKSSLMTGKQNYEVLKRRWKL